MVSSGVKIMYPVVCTPTMRGLSPLVSCLVGSGDYFVIHNANKFNCILNQIDPKVKYLNKAVRNVKLRAHTII